ncbi:MAG: hypothetical protein IJX17_03175 [Clostridia bacterium]|nr:hypothetical protein [Clostridia bacterium]
MKKVYLFFREFELGFLTEQDNKYLWTPNISQINEFEKKYPMSWDFMFISKNEPTFYDEIPQHFINFVESSYVRQDLRDHAKIEKNDDKFDRLYKMATLDYYDQDFVIKIKE